MYVALIKNYVKEIMDYRVDFLIGLLSVLVEQTVSIIFLIVVFNNVKRLLNWGFYELLLIYAFGTLGRSIHLVFFDNLWIFGSKYILMGGFDRVLVKPINPLFQIIAEKVNFQGIGQFVAGVVAMVVSLRGLDISLGFVNIILTLVFIVCSGGIFIGIHLLLMSFSFWIIDSQPIVSSIFSLNQFAQYPLQIYPKVIRLLILFFIPYSFTSFIPANLFLHENEFSTYIYFIPVICFLFLFLSYRLWLLGTRYYKSTGS